MADFSSRLLSVSLLHRHGARGPGGSEMKPFAEDSPVKMQWDPTEYEEITSVGAQQMTDLGLFFAKKYLPMLGDVSDRTFWRSSKAVRARQSGDGVIRSINTIAGSTVIAEEPIKYEMDADHYFRPWKIYKPVVDELKTKAEADPEWLAKAHEHRDPVVRVLKAAGVQEKICSKPVKSIWTTTYISYLRNVETYWPQETGKRTALTDALVNVESIDIATAHSLACWVIQKRFIDCTFYPLLGGRLTAEILERALDPRYSLCVYSAHDYTVLSVLSNLRVLPMYETLLDFACTMTVEVWEGKPPDHPSGPSRILLSSPLRNPSDKVVRILLNASPYRDFHSKEKTSIPQDLNEIVLAEFTEVEARGRALSIFEAFEALAPTAPTVPAKEGHEDDD